MFQSDISLFVEHDGIDVIVLLLYVDDIILTGSNKAKVQEVIQELGDVFELNDMGILSYFLGLQIEYKENGDIFINQSKYARDFINKAGINGCKPTAALCKPHTWLLVIEGNVLEDPSTYRSLVGALQYLTFTRPDLSFAVNVACQYMTNPTDIHFGLVKMILRYVQGTVKCGPTYSASQDSSITAFSYSD
ncbi:hypothetical protein ACFX2F_019989 [Malus domestica]